MAASTGDIASKLIFVGLIIVVVLLLHRFNQVQNKTKEGYMVSPVAGAPLSGGVLPGPVPDGTVLPSEERRNEDFKPVDFATAPQYPADCYPQDKLTAEDLLPKDAANSPWAQVNPAGQGDIQNPGYLTAAYHLGINTVGQSLRNANYQLRSDPPIPRVPVSPWNQSTIEPDLNRRPFEIGVC